MSDPAAVVRRYYAIVADLGSTPEALLEVLHPDVRITEHPNPITPNGAVRDRDATVEGFLAGKQLLSAQSMELHEVVASGDRVAVRATWRGTARGADLVAHVSSWLTVDDGRIREHETFDCYEPLP